MTSMTKEIKGPNNLKLKLAPVRRYLKTSRLIALPLDYQIEQAEDIKKSDESEAENHLTNLKLKTLKNLMNLKQKII